MKITIVKCDTCEAEIPEDLAVARETEDGKHQCEDCEINEEVERMSARAVELGYKLIKPRPRKQKDKGASPEPGEKGGAA